MADQRNQLLVGQIALDLGFVTPEQLQECLELQAGQSTPRPLGEVLLQIGALKDGQWELILAEQGRRLAESVQFSNAPKDAMSFGRILVREGFTPQGMVDQALRAQQDMAERSSRKRLGEILVGAGHLAPRDVHRALWLQGKILLACLPCGLRTNVLVVLADNFPCTRCGLALTPEGEAVGADASAYELPAVRPRPQTTHGLRAPGDPEPAPATRPATRMVSTRVIRRKSNFPLQVGLLTLLGAVLGGAGVFLAMKADKRPLEALASREEVRQEPAPVPSLPAGPAPPPASIIPASAVRAARRLIVEIISQVRYYECQVGIVSAEGAAEAQQVLRDSGPSVLTFDTLPAGAKHLAILPRLGVLPFAVSVWLPESGDLRLKVELKASTKLTGTVIDDSRHPVAGARVTYTLPDFLPAVGDRNASGFLFMGAGTASFGPTTTSTLSRSGVLRISASTDSAGQFTLDGLPSTPVALKVSSGTFTLEASGLKPGEPATIRLPARRP